MILNKYQTESDIQKRGYSLTSKIKNEDGDFYFAKWILGIEKNSEQSKILYNKLRLLKRAINPSLPSIKEFDWDEQEKAYCIVYDFIKARSLEEIITEISPINFLTGLIKVTNCLQELQQKFRITHGDLTPANILVDDQFNFYLIDFGVADISLTLSQEKGLEVFAKDFAAPEKWNEKIPKGFGYQSDVFSLGKIISFYLKKNDKEEYDDLQNLILKSCEELPSKRCSYNELVESLHRIIKKVDFKDGNFVYFDGLSSLMEDLNHKDFVPLIDVNPKKGENILFDIISNNYFMHCMWIIREQKIIVREYHLKSSDEEKYNRVLKYGTPIGVPINFLNYKNIHSFDFLKVLQNKQNKKQEEFIYSKGKREVSKELNFYKDLIKQELSILEQNSLRLRYINFEKKNDYEVWFTIKEDEKLSSTGLIFSHIDKSLPPNPEEFEYELSEKADKKQVKTTVRFTGIAYDFNLEKRILKFKDCEGLKFNSIPNQGYLFENISKKEEEKKRQQAAIRKVENNEVQNRELIHYLFNPSLLKGTFLNVFELETIFQTDDKNIPFSYSPNQTQAILNAIHRTPLSVIQGPPGTGKTTVITEIVFQILHQNPNAKILITSQTNDAVDNVLENLLEKDIPIVRLSGVRKPKERLKKHTLERKIEGWKEKVLKKAKESWIKIENDFYESLKREHPILISIVEIILNSSSWRNKKNEILNVIKEEPDLNFLTNHLNSYVDLINSLEENLKIDLDSFFKQYKIHKDWFIAITSLDESSTINQKLIDNIKVIGATTNHIASKKYSKYNFEFDYVIMDESGKATTAEALIPIVLADKLILVGDHRQLRPMLTSSREVEKWLRDKYKTEQMDYDSWDDYFNRPSLFEQVILSIDEDFKSQLETCRRMPKDAVALTSTFFYESFGDKPIQFIDRPKGKEHNLDLQIDSSILFIDIGNTHKSIVDGGGSSKNKQSALLIPEILKRLDKHENVKDYSVGIITGYTAQLKEIKKVVRESLYKTKLKTIQINKVDVSVVDKFQGLEKDIIIFDLVRSQQKTLGFLANANRINVALSRHKKLLIIIGNYDWLVQVDSGKKAPLQDYLRALKKDWIVNNIEQIF